MRQLEVAFFAIIFIPIHMYRYPQARKWGKVYLAGMSGAALLVLVVQL